MSKCQVSLGFLNIGLQLLILKEFRGLKILLNHHSRKIQHHSLKVIQEMSTPLGQSICLQCWGIGKLGSGESARELVKSYSRRWPAAEI